MPNYNAKENSNNFGGLGPIQAGKLGGRKKGENQRKRRELRLKEEDSDIELNKNRKKSRSKSSK